MRAFKVFIFGLLYGWIIKIAFDRIYRENEMEDIRNENASLRDYIRSLELQLRSKSLEARSAQRERSAPQALPVEAPAPATATAQKDNLRAIKGIGPAIEKKLNDAGIQTYAALAGLTRKELENILGSQVKRLQDENDLIAQARKLARQK
jgi:predicted flap endonuclease-1-like 5' DNA nuclease